MALNAYDSCPCGSGKQFKWCCQPYYGHVEKSLRLLQSGQKAAAEHAAIQFTEKFPDVPSAWTNLAVILAQVDKYEEADKAVVRALEVDPNFAYAHFLRGVFRSGADDPAGALTHFRKAAELYDPKAKPNLADTNAQIANHELQFNHPVAARAALERSLAAEPTGAEVRNALEGMFGPESNLPEAARKPYSFRPLSGHPLPDPTSSRLTESLKAFESIGDDDPAGWFNIGLVRAWLGDNSRAIEALLKSVDFDPAEATADESIGLIEVLRRGYGMEAEADFVEHRAFLPITQPKAIGQLLDQLVEGGRLAVLNVDQENSVLTALVLDEVPDFGVPGSVPLAPLLSYFVLDGQLIRLWHPDRARLDRAIAEIRQRVGAAIGEPVFDTGPSQFADVVAQIMLYPVRDGVDPNVMSAKLRERSREYFEENWIHRSLKSLNGATPIDAASHPTLKRRLPGLIHFMDQCLNNSNSTIPSPYDFDRLRRKLGLSSAPAIEGAAIEFDTLGAADLGGLNADALTDDQLGQAFRAALKLDAEVLAEEFAKHAVGRATIADRYSFFAHLIRAARDNANLAEELRLLEAGTSADAATNGGGRALDYALSRGRTLARSGDVDGAYAVFQEAMARSPDDSKVYGPAAEAMLGRKQGTRALEFAEAGLALARKQNNRDAEQQFLELVSAACRQIA